MSTSRMRSTSNTKTDLPCTARRMDAPDTAPSDLSRRRFVKWIGGCAAALALSTTNTRPANAVQVASANGMTSGATEPWGILIDTTRCTGCQSCVLACRDANDLQGPPRPSGFDANTLTWVDEHIPDGVTARDGVTAAADAVPIKRQCMHCLHPACVAACTVGALRKSADGPVVYDAQKCIGCRYCQYACPFGVPTYDWQNPLGLIHKCQMCVARLANGELPACVASCPNGALRFGPRSALLAQAHAQIATNANRYVNHVYGEHEGGGTSVLYLAAVPFDRLGFPQLAAEPPSETAETVMHNTPMIAVGVAAVATGLNFLTRHLNAEHSPFADDDPQGRTDTAPPSRDADTRLPDMATDSIVIENVLRDGERHGERE